jgi:streptogramin lyase
MDSSGGVARSHAGWAAVFALLLCICCAAPVLADTSEEEGPSLIPPSAGQEVLGAIEAESSNLVVPHLTDPSAAEGTPLEDLGRSEALQLLTGVFGAEVEGPAGPFDELTVEKFLADNVALIPAGQQPEAPAASGEEPGSGGYEAPTLLASSVPLRTEATSGEQETVDLGLEHAEGQIEQANPIVEVGVPTELGEGIELPEAGVQIELPEAPTDRAASTVSESVAFYPNIAEDTDFAVAPTPTGVETLTQIRSPSAPRSQVLSLDLPSEAVLQATESGGAEVVQDGEPLVDIAPPIAIDVNGARVSVDMEVAGDSLVLEISPEESTEFPVLLDPLFQVYEWNAKKTRAGINTWASGEEEWSREGIIQHSGGYSNLCNNICSFGQEAPLSYELPGLWVQKGDLNTSGDHASWIYTVPRYFTDQAKYGTRPQSFIKHMTLSKLHFKGFAAAKSPYLVAGLWDPNNGWVSLLQHEGSTGHGLVDMAYTYQFPNPNANTNVKVASAGLWSLESGTSGASHLYVGAATTELAEPANAVPGFGSASGPSAWVNQSAAPISFTVSDAGLGVYAVSVSDEQTPSHTWKTSYGCSGVGGSACPRAWSSTGAGQPALKYEPAVLPQGTNYLTLVAEDPLGNVSTPAKVQVKVDHTAPEFVLSGTLTEQAKLGLKHPTYTLKVSASDGTEASPQSGAAKTVVKVDGKVVDQASPGCATKNCAISREWTLDASQYSAGQHTVEVTATDAVGLATTKSISIELHPAPPPALELSGTMTEQGTLGASRPRYKLTVDASAEAGEKVPSTFSSSFGTSGTGNGQFEHPAGAAIDSKGFLWVVDQNRDRIQKFKEGGEYVTKFGSSGTADGKFGRPTDVAIDSTNGNFWVTDAGNKRVEVFNEKREYVAKIESAGSAGALSEAESVAIGPWGNVWVADTGNGRLLRYDSGSRNFLEVVGAAELVEPVSVDTGPEGKVWVVDRQLNRVFTFNPYNGELLSQFGTEGSGRREFIHPGAIEVSPQGNVWVADEGNGRVLEFDEAGNYVAQFGSPGAGQGELNFSAPMGIVADAKGHIWVADSNSDRVQRWQIPSHVPTGSGTFGTSGTGNGQFEHPAGIAVAPNGSVWVADFSNHRLQRFNEAGEYQGSFGTKGSKKGEFSSPTDVAIDSEGNFWVANRGNCRIDKFDASHKYILSIDTESKLGECNGSNGAEGVAVDLEGDVWVAETYNGRVKEYDQEGTLIRSVYKASPNGPEQFYRPTGIDVGPDGHVWVTEGVWSWVTEFDQMGQPVRKFGYEGTGSGQFQQPAAIDVDERGNVWVADQGNNRIQEFSRSGEYVAQFGVYGSGEGKFNFSAPMGIATDLKGNLWIADPGNNRVQKWRRSTVTESTIETEVSFDGDQVDSEFSNCVAEACPVEDEWMLDSLETPIGDHTVKVTATDGFGRTTTEALEVEVQPDTAKPTLEVEGELVEAPEGWVEQDDYSLAAVASDHGYGVMSLIFKMDGTEIASSPSGVCPDGGCAKTITQAIDMAPFSGGAHQAELIAVDGAGNATKNVWTLNVDPSGHVTTAEAIATLEAVDETSAVNTVGPAEFEAAFEGTVPGLGVEDTGSEMKVTGTEVPATISTDPGAGVTLEIPEKASLIVGCPTANEDASFLAEVEEVEGVTPLAESQGEANCDYEGEATDGLEPVVIEPVSLAGSATNTTTADTVATVSANTVGEVDTVIRPLFDGVMTFAAIRSSEAPESYSWRVNLDAEQELVSVDGQHATVYYKNGPAAFSITAEPAHDAVGVSVPTTLNVSGSDTVTLIVEHRPGESTGQPFVYPIVAGAGWQGGFRQTVTVTRPLDELEQKEKEEEEKRIKEEIAQEEREAAEAGIDFEVLPDETGRYGESTFGPPVADTSAVPSGASKPSGVAPRARAYNFFTCRFYRENGSSIPRPPVRKREAAGGCHGSDAFPGFKVSWAVSMSGVFHYKYGHWVWVNSSPNCQKWGEPLRRPAIVHCYNSSPNPSNVRLDIVSHLRFTPNTLSPNPVTAGCAEFNGVLPLRPAEQRPYTGRHHWKWVGVLVDDPCPWGHFQNPIGY